MIIRKSAAEIEQMAAIVVPAGFTREVYDRVPDDGDPNGSRLEGPKKVEVPVALEFLARPFEEPTLFAIASAFESIKRHRRPPPGFGELADGTARPTTGKF